MEANFESHKAESTGKEAKLHVHKAKLDVHKWTFMVFIAGDNNLDPAALRDIAEMAKVGSSEDLNVIVQLDRANDQKTRRFYITEGGGYKKDCIETFEETNTGDPAVLENFILWGMEKYPAERYALVVWNHGGGWWDEDIRAKRNIGYDDSSDGDALDNQELRDVLDKITRISGHRLAILGMDACLMGMIEVAWQLRSSVDVLVGSEEEEPFDGWPYDRVLSWFRDKPASGNASIAKRIVSEYIAFYRKEGEAVTQAAYNLRFMDSLMPPWDALCQELVAGMQAPPDSAPRKALLNAVVDARQGSLDFFYGRYIDLYQFVYLLKAKCVQAEIRDKAAAVLQALKPGAKKAILSQKHLGRELKKAHGMSIYFPLGEFNPKYRELDFYKDCHWGAFLEEVEKAAAGGEI